VLASLVLFSQTGRFPKAEGRGEGEQVHRVRMSGAGVAPLLPGGNLPEEPASGMGPTALGGGDGDAEDFCRLFHGKPNELAKLEVRWPRPGGGGFPP
jgi:hypothetical protein